VRGAAPAPGAGAVRARRGRRAAARRGRHQAARPPRESADHRLAQLGRGGDVAARSGSKKLTLTSSLSLSIAVACEPAVPAAARSAAFVKSSRNSETGATARNQQMVSGAGAGHVMVPIEMCPLAVSTCSSSEREAIELDRRSIYLSHEHLKSFKGIDGGRQRGSLVVGNSAPSG